MGPTVPRKLLTFFLDGKGTLPKSEIVLFAGAAVTPLWAQTFTKDVAPIFQKHCQSCHHEGTVAPMSLMTYKDARPWARAIKERVLMRDMPPWHLDKTVGIRRYKNDISLTDREIDTIAKWVDAGAPEGDAADMTKMLTFASEDEWSCNEQILPRRHSSRTRISPSCLLGARQSNHISEGNDDCERET